ncbi:hypothetical protein SH449x_004001 [Pirellulaceae bacterium SH449]
MLSILVAYLYLVIDKNGTLGFDEFRRFAFGCGWLYLFASGLMAFGYQLTKKLPVEWRLSTVALLGLAISYVCHSPLSLISWYWSIWLVFLIALVFTVIVVLVNSWLGKAE